MLKVWTRKRGVSHILPKLWCSTPTTTSRHSTSSYRSNGCRYQNGETVGRYDYRNPPDSRRDSIHSGRHCLCRLCPYNWNNPVTHRRNRTYHRRGSLHGKELGQDLDDHPRSTGYHLNSRHPHRDNHSSLLQKAKCSRLVQSEKVKRLMTPRTY